MSVRVHIDKPHGHIYTSLDWVTGRVIVFLPNDTTITAITVKLQGETRTKLEGAPRSDTDQKKKVLLELHKVLYRVDTLFPEPGLVDVGNGKACQYTLSRGQYEYPFAFQLPVESDCNSSNSALKNLSVGPVSLQYGQEPVHIKAMLPPSLAGYPGEVEVKYYVKATIVRPKLWQENIRSETPIRFYPLERRRPVHSDGETFGRRKHKFQPYSTQKRLSAIDTNSAAMPAEEPLEFQVDVRLPNPAILTCQQPVPVRILVNRLNNTPATVYLDMLQIELIGRTEVRAYDIQRKENNNWLLVSLANMNTPLEHPANKQNQWVVPSRFWKTVPLPTTVIPSFRTCNISRTYELEVRVGLTHGAADGVRPEVVVSPLRLDVEVWSGKVPPPELPSSVLDTQAPSQTFTPQRMNSLPMNTLMPGAFPLGQSRHYPHLAAALTHSPVSPVGLQQSSSPSGLPHQYSTPATIHDDLPPSYEDVMAADIPVADGPRRGYVPGNNPPRSADGKNGLSRRVSERLFSSNAAQPPQGPDSSNQNPYGGDPVPDELSDDQETNESSRQDDDYRPPLPARKTTR